MNEWFRRLFPFLIGLGVAQGARVLLPRTPRFRASAWTGAAGIADPATALARARASGLAGLDCFVNDTLPDKDGNYGAGNYRRHFHLYDRDKVLRACEFWRKAGLEVSLTSWIRPEPDWCDGMAQFGQLATDGGAIGANLDTEEPWLHGVTPATAPEWSRRAVSTLRTTYRGKVGSTFIVGADLAELGAFLELVNVLIPQAYATVKNAGALKPGDLERRAIAKFAKYNENIIMGAAAWNLVGAYGRTNPVDAMLDSLQAASALVHEIRYWRLEMLNGDLAVAVKGFVDGLNREVA